MIYSKLSDCFYDDLDDKVALCMKKAKEMNADTPLGRTDFSEDVFVNVMTYEPRPIEGATAETHERYADIQLILDGEELMGVPIGELTVETEYSAEKDIAIWSGAFAYLTMKPGDWCMFMPGEGHAPSIRDDSTTCRKVKKAVFKIRYR